MKISDIKITCLAITVFICTALPAFAAGTAMPDAIPDGIVPHKALYDIKMISKKSSAQIVNISGQMFYEWRPACDAWITDHRFNLYYEYADSPPLRITSDFSTYETYDARTLNFNSRRQRDGELFQEISGKATLGKEEKGEAVYNKPNGLVFDLKKDTLFPMAHTLKLLEKAKENKKFYNATVFDGSDEEGPVEISAFIGDRVNAMAKVEPAPSIDTTLINTPAWNIRMAFFPLAEHYADAEYEMDAVFHENGIISDMVVEYRDFAVSQKLVAIEELEPVKCDTAGEAIDSGPE